MNYSNNLRASPKNNFFGKQWQILFLGPTSFFSFGLPQIRCQTLFSLMLCGSFVLLAIEPPCLSQMPAWNHELTYLLVLRLVLQAQNRPEIRNSSSTRFVSCPRDTSAEETVGWWEGGVQAVIPGCGSVCIVVPPSPWMLVIICHQLMGGERNPEGGTWPKVKCLSSTHVLVGHIPTDICRKGWEMWSSMCPGRGEQIVLNSLYFP